MKNLLHVLAIIAIFLVVACQKESLITKEEINQNQSTEISTIKNYKVGDIVDMVSAQNAENQSVPDSIRMQFSPNSEQVAFEDSIKNSKSQLSLRAAAKQVKIFSYLYCQSKGGDDGSTLEVRGTISSRLIDNLGRVIKYPDYAAHAHLFHQAAPYYASIKPGQTISTITRQYSSVENPYASRLVFDGELWDDDVNSDDGYWANKSDYLGARKTYIFVSEAMTSTPKTVWQMYADGNQIVWAKYNIYVY